ncbi:MAG: MoxR family ATPase [Burkholderiaceae bacterium]|nr:MoxR family ATPase [Burkholderiaceae bacterium]
MKTAPLPSLIDQLETIIKGKRPQVELAVCCLLASGHLLIEDLPGVGKTTLAHALAAALGLQYARAQFTADLMPGDLLGISVFDRNRSEFVFHPGPVFSQVLLADEINRAGPKVQSALLEAMEERQVSVDGLTRKLPEPFFVIATQNPFDQLGTYALPESQLDRFLLCISLGYPSRAAERALLEGRDRRELIAALQPTLNPASLMLLQRQAQAVHAAPALLDYVQELLMQTRNGRWFIEGLSPRAGLGLLRAARAWALLQGRDYLIPDDVQQVFPAVAGHRLRTLDSPVVNRPASLQAVQAVLEQTPV